MTVIYKKKSRKEIGINNHSLINKDKGLLIPKIFHRTWFGNKPMPKEYIKYGDSWIDKHPDWKMKLWTDENIIELFNQKEFEKTEDPVLRSDIARYELIYRFGGVYIDCDFECLKNIEDLITGIQAFSSYEAYEVPGLICGGICGCTQGHPAFKALIDNMAESIKGNKHLPINHQAGPHYHTRIIGKRNDVVIFPPKIFYPYYYTEMHRKNEDFPEAYAIHHWARSWL